MSPASKMCALCKRWYGLVLRHQRVAEAEAAIPSWRKQPPSGVATMEALERIFPVIEAGLSFRNVF